MPVEMLDWLRFLHDLGLVLMGTIIGGAAVLMLAVYIYWRG